MNRNYDDIIGLPHPEPQTHPRMSLHDRAAQFSPFAALTGHSAAIAETGRLTDSRVILDEYEMARVDDALQKLQELLPQKPMASVTYFVPDAKKAGGGLPDDTRRCEADRRGQRRPFSDRSAYHPDHGYF